MKMPETDLGFPEKCPGWKLESRFFPSKLGGIPAWLDLLDLPSPADLACQNCQEQMKFLCQIYAPINDKSQCFHRTVFVFLCSKAECCNLGAGSFQVFRCQLPRENSFYPNEPSEEIEACNADLTPVKFGVNLCSVCGVRGPFNCGQCRQAHYCSKEHQVFDWKNGHKQNCGTESGRTSSAKNLYLLPEFEIAIEPDDYSDSGAETEEDGDANEEDGTSTVDQEQLKKLMKEGKAGTLADAQNIDDDLNQMALHEEDTTFTKFKSIIMRSPEQIIRYQWDGSPLWITDKHLPQLSDIPKCAYCQGDRVFEFQILPQMLNLLKWDKVKEASIDWGVLAVYTCQNNCGGSPAYKNEFLWRQSSA